MAAIGQMITVALDHYRDGNFSEAESLCWKIIDVEPDHATAVHLLGAIALQTQRYELAVQLIERAHRLEPDNATFLSNLGEAYQRLDRFKQAETSCREAVRLDSTFAPAYHNLANALKALGQFDAAEKNYRMAIALDASLSTPKLNLGLLNLQRGDYAAGLPLYESRLEGARLSQNGDTKILLEVLADVPQWRGEPLQGKSMVVWTEQGLGDSLMMMRYLPLIKNRGLQHLTMCCEQSLVGIVRTFPAVDVTVSRSRFEDARNRFDFHCPMMSLPLAFGTRVDNIPNGHAYLQVPAMLKRKWTDKLGECKAPRVGIVWASGKLMRFGTYRDIRLEQFAPILECAGGSFVSLQKGEESGQLRAVNWEIKDWMDECKDLLETAALIEQLDVVISVDTSVAHLTGVVGKPVWLLNSRPGAWQWLWERADSPWYPTMRIFQQTQLGDWASVMEQVACTLRSQFGFTRPLKTRLLRWTRSRGAS